MLSLGQLALRSLWNRRGLALCAICSIALSVFALLGVQQIRQGARSSFAGTVAGTDLIVGARSSPLSLLLYSIFHLGEATHNLAWTSYQTVAAWPEVAWAVPLSLGDSHRGFRVLGTTHGLYDHYRYGAGRSLRFASGQPNVALYEAVVGAEVAAQLDYAPGREIILAHGIGSFVEHRDRPFQVSGVLARTGTPLDRTVIVSLQAIEAIHAGWQSGIPGPTPGDASTAAAVEPASITAILLGLRQRTAVFALQRRVNTLPTEPLQAIMPGVALQQLWGLVGVAETALYAVSGLVLVAGLCAVFAVLLSTLAERRREIAVLRAVGAHAWLVLLLLLGEAALLSLTGVLLGAALLLAGLLLAQGWIAQEYGLLLSPAWPDAVQWGMVGAVLLAGLLAGVIPAALAYRQALIDGLTPRT